MGEIRVGFILGLVGTVFIMLVGNMEILLGDLLRALAGTQFAPASTVQTTVNVYLVAVASITAGVVGLIGALLGKYPGAGLMFLAAGISILGAFQYAALPILMFTAAGVVEVAETYNGRLVHQFFQPMPSQSTPAAPVAQPVSAVKCGRCGASVWQHQKFCQGCGTPLQ